MALAHMGCRNQDLNDPDCPPYVPVVLMVRLTREAKLSSLWEKQVYTEQLPGNVDDSGAPSLQDFLHELVLGALHEAGGHAAGALKRRLAAMVRFYGEGGLKRREIGGGGEDESAQWRSCIRATEWVRVMKVENGEEKMVWMQHEVDWVA